MEAVVESCPSPQKVVVVGGGVVGLSTAIVLARAGHAVRVYDTHSQDGSCSVNSGAVWGPFLSERQPRSELWSLSTHAELVRLSRDPRSGVELVAGVGVEEVPEPTPWWVGAHPGARALPQGDFYRRWGFRVPILDMPKYLAYLRDVLASLGGVLDETEIGSVSPLLREADHVVVSAGLRSPELAGVPNDLVPVRGQLVVVANEGIRRFTSVRGDGPDLTYILPQTNQVVLGGTAEWQVSNPNPSQTIANAILDRCARYEPRLRGARILGHRVGIRPYRHTVRVEHAASAHVIFNYGHGGSGVSLSWGCAAEVEHLVASCGTPFVKDRDSSAKG